MLDDKQSKANRRPKVASRKKGGCCCVKSRLNRLSFAALPESTF
jgi:hypothetical protein